MRDVPRSNAASVSDRRTAWIIGAALVIVTIIAYLPAISAEFVIYDDHRYITMNPRVQQGLTFDNIAWAFTTFEVANWHPLTWMSHMLECSIFRRADGTQWPGGHHLINVLMHAANTLVVFLLLQRMTGALWRSAAVAALFALHPLHVESVAWVSERKDVLSTLFGLLAIAAYLRWVHARRAVAYAVMLVLFACSLMSKPMLVTLPVLLMLLDAWPLRRMRLFQGHAKRQAATEIGGDSWRSLIVEKLPLLALSIASAIITINAQSAGGAVSTLEQSPLADRFVNAIVACAMYLKQMLWPVNLAPFYPRPANWPPTVVIASAATLLGISIAAIASFKRRPHMLVGWLWYLISLLPVIGLVAIGSAARADRYTYVPLIGVFIMIVWSIPATASGDRFAFVWRTVSGCVVLVVLAALTFRQTTFWHDSITLGEHTIAATGDNAVARFNLANALVQKGENEAAIRQFAEAARINPHWADVPFNLGNAYMRLERMDEAIAAYEQAISLRPNFFNAHSNLGIAAVRTGQVDRALMHFQQAADIARAMGQQSLFDEIQRRMVGLKTGAPAIQP